MLASLPNRDSHRPGEHWHYQNWPYNALATIFQRKTGNDVFEAFHREIAQPLGFEQFDLAKDAVWENGRHSIHPAYDFRLSALDLARFGQLYLNGGTWDGKQLISEAWIRDSIHKYSHIEPGPHGLVESGADDTPGYGYLWWIETAYYGTGKRPELAGSYSAEGMGGHMVLVAPKINTVIVIRANTWLPAWTPFWTTRLDGAAVRRIIEAIIDAHNTVPTAAKVPGAAY
jgi:CubicO group peptidase (beta-lactamase class C family)